MTDNDRTTINVSKDAHRTAKAAKRDGESWTDYLLRCTDKHPREDTARVVVEEICDELGIEGDADIPTVVKNATATDVDAEAIAEHLDDALDTASMAADPGATEEAVDDLTREVRKAQELAEQARDAAQRVEEGMGR